MADKIQRYTVQWQFGPNRGRVDYLLENGRQGVFSVQSAEEMLVVMGILNSSGEVFVDEQAAVPALGAHVARRSGG